jgi:hypothetical protein
MVFYVTFNNISAISWRSVLLVEEPEVPGENTELSQVTDKLHDVMLCWLHNAMTGIRTNKFRGDRHLLYR